jgi:hypothetical protein
MNTSDVLKYGHKTLLATLGGVPKSEWNVTGVCGIWSVKDIVAHLASYEHVLVDVLNTFTNDDPTPYLDQFTTPGGQFNERQVALRQDKSVEQVLAEYEDTHDQVMALLPQIPEQIIPQPGTLPWYGPEYALDDFIVYSYYGHKREHSAQINVFRDQLAS